MAKCPTCGQLIGAEIYARFKAGDAVTHKNRGAGVVRSVEPDGLHIEFEDYPGRISAIFDYDWFRINPTLLNKTKG